MLALQFSSSQRIEVELTRKTNRHNSVEKIVSAMSSLLPAGTTEDIRNNIRLSVKASLESMDFVTQSELEVQEKMLRRARQRIQELESRVSALEEEIRNSS